MLQYALCENNMYSVKHLYMYRYICLRYPGVPLTEYVPNIGTPATRICLTFGMITDLFASPDSGSELSVMKYLHMQKQINVVIYLCTSFTLYTYNLFTCTKANVFIY